MKLSKYLQRDVIMNKSETIAELLKALSKFQGELENVEKGREGHGYKYATLGNCIDAAKPALTANGLSVTQLLSNNEKGEVTMETVLGHSTGEYISSMCVMPIAKLQGGGGSNPAQIMGASITYMRRYQYAAIIGLAQDDTDGVPQVKNKKLEFALDTTAKSWIVIGRVDIKNLDEIIDPAYKEFIKANL
jgi:hypothetical protein